MRSNTLALGLLAVLLGVFFAGLTGCGDDSGSDMDASDGDGDGDGPGTGGRMGLPMVDGGDGDGDGDAGAGEVVEGGQCRAPSDCAADLTCVDTDLGVGVCARPCETDAECGAELCQSYTGLLVDAHCMDVVREAFAFCGPALTSNCSATLGLTCLLFPSSTVGTCEHFCAIAEAEDDGGVSDVDAGVGDLACTGTQSCIADTVAPNDRGIDGVCGEYVGRGEPCGLDGKYCESDLDICQSAEPENADSTDFRCFQDCTRGETCDEGACMPFRAIAYCR